MVDYKDILWRFFSKRVGIKNDSFYPKTLDGKAYGHLYGSSVVDDTAKIFAISHDIILEFFKDWAFENGFTKSDELFKLAYNNVRLKTRFSNEMAQDIAVMTGDNIEEKVIRLVLDNLSEEIDTTILKDILEKNKNVNIKEFFSLVKCIGFDLSTTIYDPTTFLPMRSFISATYNDMINERQTNSHWKNWIRACGCIEKT